jgi:hypothetical protein
VTSTWFLSTKLNLWQAATPADAFSDKERYMKQYEYKVVTRLVGIEKKLNELGFEGWELVAVECGTYYFKREYKV